MRSTGLSRDPLGYLACLAGALTACSTSRPVEPGQPASIEILSGDNQTAVLGSILPDPVAVRVLDSAGGPITNRLVNFTVTSGGGTVLAGTAATNDSGIVRDRWTLGSQPTDSQRVQARLVAPEDGSAPLSLTFKATARGGRLAFVAQPTSAVEFFPLAPAVQVAAQDSLGNLAAGYTGAVTIRISSSSAGGTLLGILTRSAVNGIATFPGLRIDKASAGYVLTAAAYGLGPVSSAPFNVTPTVPARLSFQVEPASGFVGPLLPPIKVKAIDSAGNVATTFSGDVSIALRPAASATLSGSTTVAAVTGVATFSTLGVATPGSYALVASAGGVDSVTSSAFSLCADCWRSRRPIPTGRAWLGVAALNGLVYAVGGYTGSTILATVEAYDPVGDTWTSRAPLALGVLRPGIGVANGMLYVVGGWDEVQAYTSGVRAYDPATNTWTTRALMPTPREGLGIGVVNGVLYAIGGSGSGGVTGVVEAYDPVSNSWTSKAPMPTPRYRFAIGVVSGLIYVAGGLQNVGRLATVEAYDPSTNTWTSGQSLPLPVMDAAGIGVDDVLYVIGGCCGTTLLKTVWAYNPTANTGTAKAPMPLERDRLGAAVVNGVIYTVGGHTNNGVVEHFSTAHHEAFHP